MNEFTVSGQFRSRGGWQDFEKAVEAENEDVAVERVYADLGSRHHLKRTQIEVAEVSG